MTVDKIVDSAIGLLSSQSGQLLSIVNNMLGGNASPPQLIMEASRVPHELEGEELAKITGWYKEGNRLVFVNAHLLVEQAVVDRGYSVDPTANVIRAYVKEAAQHVYSSLHDFKVMSSLNGITRERLRQLELRGLKEFTPTNISLAFYPYAVEESVGFAAMLRLAKERGHADDYQKDYTTIMNETGAQLCDLLNLDQPNLFKLPDDPRRAGETLSRIRYLTEIYIGMMLGQNLAMETDSKFKRFVKLDIEAAEKVSKEHYIKGPS